MSTFLRGLFWFFTGVLAVLPLGLKSGIDKIQLVQLGLSSFASGLAAVGAHMGAANKEVKPSFELPQKALATKNI